MARQRGVMVELMRVDCVPGLIPIRTGITIRSRSHDDGQGPDHVLRALVGPQKGQSVGRSCPRSCRRMTRILESSMGQKSTLQPVSEHRQRIKVM